MRVTVDKFEEEVVVCEKEDKSPLLLKRDQVPEEVQEGDVLVIDGATISIDKEKTHKRKQQIDELTKDIWE